MKITMDIGSIRIQPYLKLLHRTDVSLSRQEIYYKNILVGYIYYFMSQFFILYLKNIYDKDDNDINEFIESVKNDFICVPYYAQSDIDTIERLKYIAKTYNDDFEKCMGLINVELQYYRIAKCVTLKEENINITLIDTLTLRYNTPETFHHIVSYIEKLKI